MLRSGFTACLGLALAACSSEEAAPTLPSIDEIPTFDDVNKDPHVVEVNLRASETEVELTPGHLTKVMAYNDRIPAPLLEARVGDRVIVHFQNDLSEPTTIHWHGLRISSDMDGNPMIQQPIPPGGTFDYDFVVPDAGTFWFHPHYMTTEQIERGLYGAIVVAEPAKDAPRFSQERVFVLDDVRLDSDFQISPFLTSGEDIMMGRFGNTLLVNGSTVASTGTAPQLAVERWRLVNSAGARVMEVSVEGASWRVIASDGGLVPTPYTSGRIDIAPGQRYDVEVTYNVGDATDARLVVHVPISDTQWMPYVMADIAIDGQAKSNEPPVYAPAALPPVPDAPLQKIIRLGATSDGYTINGMIGGDMTPIDQYTQNVPVVFTIVNELGMYHPFHLHGQFFQILSRDGHPANEPGLKDTVLVDGGETVRIMTGFENPGRWMYHCHIPEHSENGMMAQLDVVPN